MAIITGALIGKKLIGTKLLAGGAVVAGGVNVATNVVGTAATVVGSGVSAAMSVGKFALKAASVCVGLVGGAIKCAAYLNERRKAKKKANAEEKKQEEMMRRGIVPNYAYQSHYAPPTPTAPQPEEPPKKGDDGSSELSTVFDKRSAEERRQEGGYIEGETPAAPPDKKIVPDIAPPSTPYKGLSTQGQTPARQSLPHNMEEVKAEVAADRQAHEDKVYQHHRQSLIDKCENDLLRIKEEYKKHKASYKASQKGVRGYLPGSGKIAEASMEYCSKQFNERQDKLERDLAELANKHGRT